jgi:hypothetical protein
MGLDNLINAQRAYDRQEPEPLPEMDDECKMEPTLAMQIADFIEAGGRERLLALADFVIDEMRLTDERDPVSVLAHWINGGSGPRDFDIRR